MDPPERRVNTPAQARSRPLRRRIGIARDLEATGSGRDGSLLGPDRIGTLELASDLRRLTGGLWPVARSLWRDRWIQSFGASATSPPTHSPDARAKAPFGDL